MSLTAVHLLSIKCLVICSIVESPSSAFVKSNNYILSAIRLSNVFWTLGSSLIPFWDFDLIGILGFNIAVSIRRLVLGAVFFLLSDLNEKSWIFFYPTINDYDNLGILREEKLVLLNLSDLF